jgi:hypothetical protein
VSRRVAAGWVFGAYQEHEMKRIVVAGVVAVVLAGGAAGQDVPKPPAPQKEHAWLRQFAGEWEAESEMVVEPGKSPVKCKATETARVIGGFWVMGEFKGEFMGAPMTGVMTLGYDPAKKKYVGTWVCSMCDHLWTYEGTVDASGKVLTLETEGPNPAAPGKTAKMRDVIEWKDKDTRVMTSAMLGDDGKWHPFMTMTARRKK